jgi:hypothetical protein
MTQNFYPNGRCDIIVGDVGIYLMADHRIYYCYFDDEGDADYKYDLLSHVGEIWKQEILDILANYNIVTGHYESATEYRDTWISYDGQDRIWLSESYFKGV